MTAHRDRDVAAAWRTAGEDRELLPRGRARPMQYGAHRRALIEGLARVSQVVEQTRARLPAVLDIEPEATPGRDGGSRALVRRGMGALVEQVRSGYEAVLAPGEFAESESDETELSARLNRTFRAELRTGLKVLAFALCIAGGWATLVPLSGAVVVPGTLVTESSVKKIQHPTGGVVAEILVRDGAHVKEGDMLARLDQTAARTNNQMVSKQLDETRARIARLTAERDGLDDLKFPDELAARSRDPDVAALLASERSLFKARAVARQSQKELLNSRIAQFREEITGLQAQIKSKESQLSLISGELTGLQGLFEKHLVPLTRLTTLQREAARIDGERGQLMSALAETQSKISEAQLQILQIDKDFRTEVMKDLRESQDKEADLVEKSVVARDQLNRIDIRAPTSGIVHQLAIHTIGGVVSAGEVIMVIVPDADGLQIEAKLPPSDIDQVHAGQKTLVRLSAFNQRTTPQLSGVVSYVSPDATQDPRTGSSYYTVRVTLPEEEHRRLGNLQLVSGMPAEVFLQTDSRTMLSYLFKPITDQLQRMFRER